MSLEKKHCVAIVLAAGSGKRMKSATAKQFMLLNDKPLIWYSLNAVEQSRVIDECILVTGEADIQYMQHEIVEKFGFKKVKRIVPGGSERYESVHNGLQSIKQTLGTETESYVFIHDGARPFLTEKILQDTYDAVVQYGACVAGMPVKDTIKIADDKGFAVQTPNRNLVWAVQTPQVFETKLITQAYEMLFECMDDLKSRSVAVTDDAFVAEAMLKRPVKLVEASYENIKITTPEDIRTAQSFLS